MCEMMSLMAEWFEWLEQASQWHEVHCHDLEVMSSNPRQVELGVRTTSVLSRTWTKNMFCEYLYSVGSSAQDLVALSSNMIH